MIRLSPYCDRSSINDSGLRLDRDCCVTYRHYSHYYSSRNRIHTLNKKKIMSDNMYNMRLLVGSNLNVD
jgi:hypothetical protein